jgi:uncharacterized protein (UPF0548 family)
VVRSQATLLPADVTARLLAAEPTYEEVGRTAGTVPAGYHRVRRTVRIGSGDILFDQAVDALFGWQVQLRAGLRVAASSARVEEGAVVRLGLGVGPIRLHAPCQVIYVVDEPHRRGFAYGTLPGHAERGEESFVIERHDDGAVTLTITAFSVPASRPARTAGPLGRVVQRWITNRYLRALTRSSGRDG